MKVKGLRWRVLGLVVLITIINYLDRGTLNYMWVANTKVNYTVVNESDSDKKFPYAVYNNSAKQYILFNSDSSKKNIDERDSIVKPKNQI